MKKNIMVVVSDLSGGGAERVATNLASSLAKTENVILVVEHINNNTYGSTVETIDVKMPKDKGKLKVFWHLELAKRLKKVKKERNITHCICFLQEAALASVLSKCGEKVYVSVRNKLSSELNPILKMKERFTFRHTDCIIALSKMVREDLIEHFGVKQDKVIAIYNPCYIETIKDKIQGEKLPDDDEQFFINNKGNIVLTAGRLVDQKGQWHLIRAFSRVINKMPDAKLLILGQGGNKDYLERLIKDYKLEDSIKLLGYKSNPYIYMVRSDIFAFSSVYEGLGNILVECMACGLPVVSADYKYGAKELLAPDMDLKTEIHEVTYGKYGILVPEMDDKKYETKDELTNAEKMLADAIIEMLQNEEQRNDYKQRIMKRAADFDPDKITQEWLDIL